MHFSRDARARECTRRSVLAVAAGTLVGCSRSPRNVKQAQVSIHSFASYSQSLYEGILQIFKLHKLNLSGKRVVLKPNLVEFEPASVINTNPLVVHAVFEAALATGARDVRIAEGPGHRRTTLDLAEAAGYFDTVPGFENRFTDLNTDDVSNVQLPAALSKLKSLYLPNTILGADLVISIPKLKTHHWVGATLSMKNLFGIVPGAVYGWPKNVLHWAGISECIADLYRVVPKHFCIVDGIVGMEGNGPIQGTAKYAGVIVAGNDMAAVDATCCRLMGIDPSKIGYLSLASSGSLAESDFEQIGESLRALAKPFALIPEFQSVRSSGV
jgi:uncharacterized protein (DUF362 family)